MAAPIHDDIRFERRIAVDLQDWAQRAARSSPPSACAGVFTLPERACPAPALREERLLVASRPIDDFKQRPEPHAEQQPARPRIRRILPTNVTSDLPGNTCGFDVPDGIATPTDPVTSPHPRQTSPRSAP